MATRTPADRNRYVDFLRSVSILVVIVGHWLIATSYMVDGEMSVGHLLKSHPRTQWLTWVFQVMPIFFIVGGYSNAVSLESARRKNLGYAGWLYARLNRLVAPLLVLLVTWGVIAVIMHLFGVGPKIIQLATQAALIPTWFLAIYVVVVLLAPVMYSFWQRLGFTSFWILVAGAFLMDLAYFVPDDMRWLGWTNYLWVWLAVHHLGFAWRDGRLGRPARLVLYSALALLTLYLMVSVGPYPLAMVGSPDEGLSNTLPPKATMLVLGVFQFGLLLALEKPTRRILDGVRVWTATVLLNSMIMTVYLWHITVMVLFVSLLYLAGGPGLGLVPGSVDWWLSRPVWIALLLVLLTPVALLLSPLERSSRGTGSTVPSPVRQVTGAITLCLGVALLAMYGIGGGQLLPGSNLGVDLASYALVVIGAGIGGLLPSLPKRRTEGVPPPAGAGDGGSSR